MLRGIEFTGYLFALTCIFTALVASEPSIATGQLRRKTGPLYPLFALYCLSVLAAALLILVKNWCRSHGLARIQLQYFSVGAIISVAGAASTNILMPLLTAQSTYGWIGPYFILPLVVLVAHAIIRHRLMDLRLVVHRGLTLAVAALMSLVPVAIFLLIFLPRLSVQIESSELLVLLAAMVTATLLVPPARDITGRLLDRYLYRTQTNFRTIVRDASRRLTKSLDLGALVDLVANAVVRSTECEGVAVYLVGRSGFKREIVRHRHPASAFQAPDDVSPSLGDALVGIKDPVIADELLRDKDSGSRRVLEELARLNWSLVLPLVFENTVIGLIAVGPKLSGDPFYPHDLDLLMTLANQAGIAIKNAQLYTQVVLANEYIENIVATIESGVVAIDVGGVVTMFNRAAGDLTGLTAEQARGRPLGVLPDVLATLLGATVDDGQGRTEPEVALPAGEITRPVLCTTSALRDPAGCVLGAVAVFSDLTSLKQLESERRRAERLAYFEILASSLAHEIKNPLVSIKTFAQLIPRRLHDASFVDEFSRIITREISRVERLVERLRSLSRPSDRPRQPVDVRLPLHDAVELLGPAFGEKRIGVELSSEPGPAVVLGDHGELEELFINLLTNAHEATPPDGAVTIELKRVAEQVIVTVADSGPGIPPQLLDRVFDPFITTKPSSSGLGLTISAGIAAAHHAKLRAVNGPAGGAVFTVELPTVPSVGAPVHEDSPARHAG
jgi:PAS domain S-box-containing protein